MKRFLSILLAAMLVTAMFPVASAATVAANGNTVYNYVFSAKALGSDTDMSIGVESGTAKDITASPLGGYMDYDDIDSSVSDKWDLLVLRSAHAYKLFTNGFYYRASATLGNVVSSGANAAVSIKINVPETGKYIPTAVFDCAYNGGIADIYLVKTTDTTIDLTANQNNVRDFIASGKFEPIGEIDTYDAKGTDAKINGPEKKEVYDATDLEKGDYYLVFALKDINSARKSADGTLPGLIYMESKSFHLEKIAPASVDATSDATEIEVGGSATVSAKVYAADNNELPDEIVFSSSDTNVATVDAATGEVTANAPGTATITATVKGTTISSSVTVTVKKTYKYIFSGTASGVANGTEFYKSEAVDYEDVEAKGISAPWDYIGHRYMKKTNMRTNGFYARAATADIGGANNAIVFKIKVSENGVYAPVLKYSGYLNGGTVAVVLAPAAEADGLSINVSNDNNGDGIATLIKKYPEAGRVNTRDSAITNENFEKISPYPMENMNLAAGEYYVAFTMPVVGEKPANGGYLYLLINSLELKKIGAYTPAEDEELSGAFDYTEDDFTTAPLTTATVNTFTAKLGESKNGKDEDVKSTTVNLGETCTVDAPAAEEGYKFLYWAKGMSTDRKQIVSYNESYSFIPTVENTYLIAVYEPISGEIATNKAEFYNANGQLIATLTADGKAPALPEMAGYNAAEGWALYGSGEVIAAGADVDVSGMKVYVAKFGNPKTVKVNDDIVEYGEKVSFTATVKDGWIFKCWTKDGVVVSADKNYSFYAWKDCTVEPVYVKTLPTFTGKAMKILVDSFSAGDKNALMAEFIGFEDAVEKGIMLGTKRFAMTTDASQFTLVNDISATEVTGYAIFKDGTIVYDK